MPDAPRSQVAQVFLSYSQSDRESATAVRLALEQAGLSVFHDLVSIREGDQWMRRLEDTLAACSSFVVLVGRDGVRRWVGAEVQVAINRHFGPQDDAERLPIFPVLVGGLGAPALPPILSLFQAATWSSTDPVPDALLRAIKAGVSLLNPPEPFDGCPFLGLNAFRKKDAQLFFGRRQETLDALACLGSQQGTNPDRLQGGGTSDHRWLQIEGSSGVGKSSLVHAGMLPMVEQGALWARTGYDNWTILGPMRPGKFPLQKLAEVLERGLKSDPERRDTLARVKLLKRAPSALAAALIDFKQEQTVYLLIIDQFEELFTLAGAEERRHFDELLAYALLDTACPLFVISTVRSDFLERYELLPCLQAAYNKVGNNYLLPTISERGLREVIELPARLAGLDVSEVTAAIVKEALGEVGALPMVENALFVLWQKRTENSLSGEQFLAQGGIAGMLSAQADALLDRIDAQIYGGRRAALELLLLLTRINDEGRHTRQRIGRDEAVEVAGNGNAVQGEQIVRLLSGGAQGALDDQPYGALRLITTHTENDKKYVDLIHETLIRPRVKDAETGKSIGYWPTLYDYILANRGRGILHQQLSILAENWHNRGWLPNLWRIVTPWELWRYRNLPISETSVEGRFLASATVKCRALTGIVLMAVFILGEGYYRTAADDLPLNFILTLEAFRLGYDPLPRFASIIPGTFTMGEQEPEFLQDVEHSQLVYYGNPPLKDATISKPFDISVFETTYDEIDYYIWDERRSWRFAAPLVWDAIENSTMRYPTTAKGGRGSRPAANVSWELATSYAKWLGKRKGLTCRLPTEAEWEYVARAGGGTAYWWGDKIPKKKPLANCRDCGSEGADDHAEPVGTYPSNRFGVHEILGNVYEWTCSVWHDKFSDQVQECDVQEKGEGYPVIRGGSWQDGADRMRASSRRTFGDTKLSLNDLGFRVVCERTKDP